MCALAGGFYGFFFLILQIEQTSLDQYLQRLFNSEQPESGLLDLR